MDALLPFLAEKFPTPNSHRFIRPKHCSRVAQKFYDEAGINWWRTPPESPDLNPIENLWDELKEYLRRVIKSRTKNCWLMKSLLFGQQLTHINAQST